MSQRLHEQRYSPDQSAWQCSKGVTNQGLELKKQSDTKKNNEPDEAAYQIIQHLNQVLLDRTAQAAIVEHHDLITAVRQGIL